MAARASRRSAASCRMHSRVGAPVSVRVSLENPGGTRRRGRYFELTRSEPQDAEHAAAASRSSAGSAKLLQFRLTPTARGMKSFRAGADPAALVLRLARSGILRIGRVRVAPGVSRISSAKRRSHGSRATGGSPRWASSPCAAADPGPTSTSSSNTAPAIPSAISTGRRR